MKKIEAVIFDMDGVIFDSEKLVQECWEEVASRYKIEGIVSVCRECLGLTREATRIIFKKHYGEDFPYDEYKIQTRELFFSKNLPIKPGTQELLTYLKDKKIKTAIASSTYSDVVKMELRKAGLIDFFDEIVCGDMVKNSKPDPEIFLKACELLHVKPENAYGIEDSYNGIRSIHAARMKAIMVPDMLAPNDEMLEKSEIVLDSLHKVKEYFMENSSTSLIFTGDIGFDKYMDGKWKDENLLDEEVFDYLTDTDHLIINVEGPLSEQKQVLRTNGVQALLHTMNPEAVGFFNKIGADVWNICNNHIMDAGADGMADTLTYARENNIKTLGAGMNIDEAASPVIFSEAGGIGLVGVGYQRACRKASEEAAGCLSWSDMERISQTISDIKSRCRWCIVVAHGGEEFTALPSPYTRQRYLDYLEMGADIVVGHHPHVPMNYETVGDKVIFYSLGNFIFDTDYQRSQYNTEFGLFIKLNFTEDSFTYEPFGIRIDRDSERIVKDEPSEIFTDVDAKEYELLAPLAAKMFIENTKRQLRYMKPDQFTNATEEDFYNNFYEPLRSGRVPGEVLDFQIIYPLSLKETEGAWKKSKLKNVVDFMLKQID